jgi:hypothetical protein
MEISEIREKKAVLESDIEELLKKFVEETKMDIEEINAHCFGDGHEIFEIAVSVTLETV